MRQHNKILNIILWAFCAFFAVSFIALALGMVLFLINIMDTSIDAGENIARVDWLPESSSRICWFKSNLSYAVEFDIPEKDFLVWVDSAEGKKRFRLGEVEPIAPTDHYSNWFYVPRYTKFLTPGRRSEKQLPPEPPDGLKIVHGPIPENEVGASGDVPTPDIEGDVQVMAGPRQGWMYHHSYGNGGGIWLAYDSETGRAFYYHSPR